MFPNLIPVPCVPVLTAPAMDWTLMSPRFSIARPCPSSISFSRFSFVPAQTVAVPAARSASTTPCMLSSEISVSLVSTRFVKEWPEPTTRTLLPRADAARTADCSSSSDRGSTYSVGRHSTRPDQFRQVRPAEVGAVALAICSATTIRCSTPRVPRNDHDRPCRATHDAVAHAAHDQIVQRAVTVRPDHNIVHVQPVALLDDFLHGGALNE